MRQSSPRLGAGSGYGRGSGRSRSSPAPLAGLAHDHRQKPDIRPAPDAAGAVGCCAFIADGRAGCGMCGVIGGRGGSRKLAASANAQRMIWRTGHSPPLPDRRRDGRRGGQEADVRGTARQPKSVEIAKILWQDFPMRQLQARSFLHGAKNTGRPEDGAMLHYGSSVLGLD